MPHTFLKFHTSLLFNSNGPEIALSADIFSQIWNAIKKRLKCSDPTDILERKLILNDTKSGKEQELIFIPQKVADQQKEYVRVQKIALKQMIFPICYGAARAMVGKAGQLVGIRLRPHDLRRHAATFASATV